MCSSLAHVPTGRGYGVLGRRIPLRSQTACNFTHAEKTFQFSRNILCRPLNHLMCPEYLQLLVGNVMVNFAIESQRNTRLGVFVIRISGSRQYARN